MKIDLQRLNPEGEHFVGTDPVEILEWIQKEGELEPSSDIQYDLSAELIASELLVRGKVSAQFEGLCSRCGDPISITVYDDEICFTLNVGEEIVEVDLTPELRESILLSLPSHPVCGTDCLGLCPRCGSRLTGGACACPAAPHPGWEALAGLDIDLGDPSTD